MGNRDSSSSTVPELNAHLKIEAYISNGAFNVKMEVIRTGALGDLFTTYLAFPGAPIVFFIGNDL